MKNLAGKDTIPNVIDIVCLAHSVGGQINSQCSSWLWKRATTDLKKLQVAEVDDAVSSSILYGISVKNQEDPQDAAITCTFYLGYSTWDGRVLCVDHMTTLDHDHDDEDVNKKKKQLLVVVMIYRVLAEIAIQLDCRRLVWQHRQDQTDIPFPSPPEKLDGWLTLHWDMDAMQRFLFGPAAIDNNNENNIPLTQEQSRQEYLRIIMNGTQRPTRNDLLFRMSTIQDVDDIGRLVQGLADFEREPDAVHVSLDQYRQDGFGEKPLFFCLLLQSTAAQNGNPPGVPYTCGMAFCFMGASHQAGDGHRFLYLEDLFIEEPFRGQGAGTRMMTKLAEFCSTLGCTQMVFQALDWNVNALNFYQNKLGARVVPGLNTSRFAGEELKRFAMLPMANVMEGGYQAAKKTRDE